MKSIWKTAWPSLLAVSVMASVSGCSSLGDTSGGNYGPEWENRLYEAVETRMAAASQTVAAPRFSMQLQEMPLRDFAAMMVREAGISLVWSESLDDRLVTVDVRDVTAEALLGVVARRMGVDVAGNGGLYYFGKVLSEDRGVLVRRVGRLSGEELRDAIGVILSDHGEAQVYNDGLCVVADKHAVLERVSEVLRNIEDTVSPVWVLQFYVVDHAARSNSEFGLKPSMDIGLAYILADGALAGGVDGTLSGAFRAEVDAENVRVVSRPLFVLADGEQAAFKAGERVPIPKRAVSDAGTVTTSGFEFIDIGFSVQVQIREVSGDRARVTVDLEQSSLKGFVEEAPIVDTQSFSTVSEMVSGQPYVLGAMQAGRSYGGSSGLLLPTNFRRESDDSLLRVWALAYRIGGGVGASR